MYLIKVIEETSDDCEVQVEEMSLGMVMETVPAVPGALTSGSNLRKQS